MMVNEQDQIYAEAVSWHARIDDAGMDWDGFAAWLDAAPEHQAVYDRVALLDADITAACDEIHAALPANDPPSHVSRSTAWRWWAAGGIAATLAVAVAPSLMPAPMTMTAYATGPAETRTVALADGSSVRLDRNTRLAVADGSERLVRLDAGAAYFDVRHDAARPFVITSGDFEVRDLGTQFSVARRDAQISVAVAEGLVDVRYRNKPALSLKAGQQLDASGGDGARVRRVDPDAVASWRDGRLVYDDARLDLIVRDMSRYSPRPVSVDPAIANLRFSGVLVIGDGSHLVDQLQSLLPVKARTVDGGVRFVGDNTRR